MSKITIITEKYLVSQQFQKYLPQTICTNTQGHLDELVSLDEVIKQKNNLDKDQKLFWKDSLQYLPLLPNRLDYKVATDKEEFFKNILKDCSCSDEIVLACDPDREGEAIHRNILILLSKRIPLKNVKITRMWVNEQTETGIKTAFADRKKYLEYDNYYQAARIRNIVDWLIGLQLTRLFSVIFSVPGKPISIGRIQTWLLAEIIKRFLENQNFDSQKYKEIRFFYKDIEFSNIDENGKAIKHFDYKFCSSQLLKLSEENSMQIISVKKKKFTQKQPKLFNLDSLQKVIFAKYGHSPEETLTIVQCLYEKGLVSYPRTDCEVLTEGENALIPDLIKFFKDNALFENYTRFLPENLALSEHHLGKMEGHTAITPVLSYLENQKNLKIIENLSGEEKDIYKSIALSIFLALSPKAKGYNLTVIGTSESLIFKSETRKYKKLGFLQLQKNNFKENQELEILEENSKIIGKYSLVEKIAGPPALYNKSSLLELMRSAHKKIEDPQLKKALKESKGIGTSATRHSFAIILLKRKLIELKGKNLIPTSSGLKLYKIIPEELKKADFSAKLEFDLDLIIKRKTDKTIKNFMFETYAFLKKTFLIINSKTQNKIIESAENSKIFVAKCPNCGWKVFEYENLFKCERNSKDKNSCRFILSKKMLGAKIGINSVKQLCSAGTTKNYLKMKSKKTGKSFKAKIKWNQSTKNFVLDIKKYGNRL